MFVQVFRAKVRDSDMWARQTEKWRKEIRPKTTGFLGFTSGVTADGEMVTVARFKSAEAAKVDNDLAEQGAWFEETTKAFEGDVTFHDCQEVDEILGGGSDRAGYVQVMQGRAKNQENMRSRGREMEPALRNIRPDIIGGTLAWHGDGGGFTQVMYFTSAEEAHKNEQAMTESSVFHEFMAQIDGDLTSYDLNEPDFE
jgi:hypothetical protein